MANKFFTMAAVASVGCLAFAAPENWFNGGLGSESASKSGGDWQNATQDGVTKENYKYVLDEPENPLAFAATNAKLPEGTNLTFTTTANFKYSYDELPAVDADAKAGVVVYTNRFYVLGKDGENPSNVWKKTEISLSSLDAEVPVSVVVTNGSNKTSVWATYTINNGTPFNTEVYVKNDAKSWNTVSYKGCGVVASLAGQTEQLGYPVPGGKDPIPADKANAWAKKYYPGLTDAQIAAMLASTETDEQGRTAAQNCILGIAQNTAIKATTEDNDATKITFAVPCDPIAGRAKFILYKGGLEVTNSSTAAIDLALGEGIDGDYKVYVSIDKGSDMELSQDMTVKSATVTGMVAYVGANMDGSLPTLVKGSCCTVGDTLEYYDADLNSYKSWVLTEAGWNGPSPVAIKKGQAVKYTASKEITLRMVGDLSNSATPIKPGDKWNLVASYKENVEPGKFLLEGEQAVVLGTDGVKPAMIYRKSGGVTKQKTGYSNKIKWVEVSGTISNGFFLKSPSRTEISWGAEGD